MTEHHKIKATFLAAIAYEKYDVGYYFQVL
jgi:hypothetical protein